MKTGGYPCEHGYYGICPQCVREERDELRTRVAELEARVAELQPMAECAAIMSVCGYFSRMLWPVAMVLNDVHPFSSVYKVEWYTNYRDLPDGTKLYAGSAPVPAAQAEAKVADGVVRDAAVGAAIERAARDLPEWCAVEVRVEKGSATVYAYDEEVEIETSGKDTLAEEINAAVEAVLAAKAKG